MCQVPPTRSASSCRATGSPTSCTASTCGSIWVIAPASAASLASYSASFFGPNSLGGVNRFSRLKSRSDNHNTAPSGALTLSTCRTGLQRPTERLCARKSSVVHELVACRGSYLEDVVIGRDSAVPNSASEVLATDRPAEQLRS